jgi:hypothetical protein
MELARLIVRSGFRPTVLVAIWRGGAPIGIAVQEVLEYHGIHTDHIAIRTSSYSGVGEHGKTVRVHAVDYLVSRLSAEDELLLPDYYVLDTDRWLVFPHEISGLTREEILEHKPVGPNFFDPL